MSAGAARVLRGVCVLQQHMLLTLHRQRFCSALNVSKWHSSGTVFVRRLSSASVLAAPTGTLSRKERPPRPRGKHGKRKPVLDDDAEAVGSTDGVLDVAQVNHDMNQELATFREKLASNLSTRIDLRVFEQIQVKLTSGKVALNHVAKVALKNPNLITITFYQPDALKSAKQALELSGMGLNPQQQGQVLMVPLSQVTREQREKLAKGAKALQNQFVERLNKVYQRYSQSLEQAKLEGEAGVAETSEATQTLIDLKHKYVDVGQQLMRDKQAQLLSEH